MVDLARNLNAEFAMVRAIDLAAFWDEPRDPMKYNHLDRAGNFAMASPRMRLHRICFYQYHCPYLHG